MKLTLIHSFTIALATATAQSLDCGVKVDAKTGILDPSTRNPACLEPIVFGALGTDQSKPGGTPNQNQNQNLQILSFFFPPSADVSICVPVKTNIFFLCPAPCVRNRDCPDGRIVLGPISYGVPYLCRDKKCTECTPDGGKLCLHLAIDRT